MTHEKQEQIISNLFEHCKEIAFGKRNDYNHDEDALSSFKQMANIADKTPEEIAFIFMSVKMVRTKNLMKKDDIMNESIEDTLLDLINYTALLYCILSEK